MKTRVGSVELWADVRCPWCWVGHRRLLKAMGAVGFDTPVVRRAFLLEPLGPARGGVTLREAALTDWGMAQPDWDRSKARIEAGGRTEGLEVRIDTARVYDSRDAHRLLKFADATDGVDTTRAWELVFDEHFRVNTDLGDRRQLVRVGGDMGLGEPAVEAMLNSSAYAAEVEADHRQAQREGITSVPTVVAGGKRLSGSHSVTELQALLSGGQAVSS